MRIGLVVACVAMLLGCGGGQSGSATTTAAGRSRAQPFSARERRALSVFPEDVFAVARVDVSAFRTNVVFEELHTAFVEADPTMGALFDDIEAMYIGIGPWVEAERMCFESVLTPYPDGCPEVDPAYAEYMDASDELHDYRVGPGRKVPSIVVVLSMRSPDRCRAAVNGADADRRGLRRYQSAGAVVFDAGEGVCGFAPESLDAHLREADGDVVSHGARALEAIPRSSLVGVAIDGRNEAFREFFWPPGDQGAFTGSPEPFLAFRMLRPLIDSLATMRIAIDAPSTDASHLSVDAEFRDEEHAIGTSAIVSFVTNGYREFVAAVSHVGSPNLRLGDIQTSREGRVASGSAPLSLELVVDHVEAVLRMSPAYRRALMEEAEACEDCEQDYDPDAYAADEAYDAAMIALEDAYDLPPVEAYVRLAAISRDDLDESIRCRFDLAKYRLASLTGRQAELAELRDAVASDVGSTCEHPFLEFELREADALDAATRHDASALEAVAETLDDYDEDDTYGVDRRRGGTLAIAVTEQLLPLLRAQRPMAGGGGSTFSRSLVDRAANPTVEPWIARLDRYLADGNWATAIAAAEQEQMRLTGRVAYDATSTEFALRGILALVGAGRASDANAAFARLSDHLDSVPDRGDWRVARYRTEYLWVRCRVQRAASGDSSALEACRTAVAIAVENHGPNHAFTARAKTELAEAELGAGHRDVSRRLGAEALAALEASTHPSHPLRATARGLARSGR